MDTTSRRHPRKKPSTPKARMAMKKHCGAVNNKAICFPSPDSFLASIGPACSCSDWTIGEKEYKGQVK
jgi:hypothetical protein